MDQMDFLGILKNQEGFMKQYRCIKMIETKKNLMSLEIQPRVKSICWTLVPSTHISSIQLPVSSDPGEPMPSSDLCGYTQTHGTHRDIHTLT